METTRIEARIMRRSPFEVIIGQEQEQTARPLQALLDEAPFEEASSLYTLLA
jgi:hypothetical protein